MTLTSRAVAAVVAGALAVAGCGGDDAKTADDYEGEEKAVAAVVDRLGESARSGDVETICEDLITEALQASVREAAGTSCAQEFQENIVTEETRYDIDEIELRGNEAIASVTDQEDRKSQLFLGKQADGWRIARID
jgi:hypothetical protein